MIDQMIIICGDQATGKSTLAELIAHFKCDGMNYVIDHDSSFTKIRELHDKIKKGIIGDDSVIICCTQERIPKNLFPDVLIFNLT